MNIQVIVGSTRPNRITERVAKWAAAEAATVDGLEVELLDLADYDLPLFNEPVSPRYNPNRQPSEVTARLLAKLAAADGFIVATPEYNHSIPAVLKNVFDYLDFQIAKKPFAIVSHGSVGGARAAEHLKAIILEGGAAVVPQAIALHGASELLDADGKYLGDTTKPYNHVMLLGAMLAELSWWTTTLKAGRDAAVAAKA